MTQKREVEPDISHGSMAPPEGGEVPMVISSSDYTHPRYKTREPIPRPIGGYMARTQVEAYARMTPTTDEQMDMQSMAVELLETYEPEEPACFMCGYPEHEGGCVIPEPPPGIAETPQPINQKLLAACKLALHAFENRWCIDWSELETAIKEAEAGKEDAG